MSIDKYLQELLRSNECVTVPGLGGFITNYQHAKINPHTFLFEPPSRFLVFNSGLKANDGLLATYISEKENINFDMAMERIWREVTSWQERLKAGKTITLLGIGSFRLNPEGKIVFEPDQNENYLDDVYGMSAFVLPPLSHAARIRNFRKKAFNTARLRKFFSAAAIIIFLLALVTWGVMNKATVAGYATQAAGFVQTLVMNIKDRFTDVKPNIPAYIEAVETAAAITIPVAPEIQPVIQPELPQALPSNIYHLISGSFRINENAKNFAETLKTQGYEPVIIDSETGLYMVSLATFFSFDSAMQKANTLRTDFPGLWVHKE